MVRTIVAIIAALLAVSSARAQTKEQWVELGTRIHGGFGVLIPIGIRIGLDAKERLKPDPRGLSVTFYSGERAPCPCIADGIMIATGASPGQATLQIASEPAPTGLYAMVIIRNRKTGEALRYTIPSTWSSQIADWNKSLDPVGRLDAAMKANGLFDVSPAN
jgi:formylmethanofuran dehydrogenase subunit E